MVQRRGGTVSLKLVGEAIARVQAGTDRTAAELALIRLGAELENLESERENLELCKACPNEGPSALGLLGMACLCIIFTIGLRFVDWINKFWEVVFLAGIIVFFFVGLASGPTSSERKKAKKELAEWERQINARTAAVRSEINEHRTFLNSRKS